MGFFNRKKRQEPQKPMQRRMNPPAVRIERSWTKSGDLQIDFIEAKPKVGQFYDTTRLVLNMDPEIMAKKEVYTGKISWYNQDDAILLKPEYGEDSRHRGPLVRLEVDPDLLETDDTYTRVVMKGLLEQKRVNRYLDMGMQTNPQEPCGDYIGGVYPDKGKIFSRDVGRKAHNDPVIADRRRKFQESERIRRAKDAKRADLYRQLHELDGNPYDYR